MIPTPIGGIAGTAYSGRGNPAAGMGVDLGDVDGDGLLDIVVTNFEFESSALYRNLGSGVFVDGRFQFNLAESSVNYLVLGVDLLDLDHDADLDLAINNSDGIAEVYENLGGTDQGNWVLLDLRSEALDRFGIGTRLEIWGGDRLQVRERRTASSYQSQNDLTVHFGLAGSSSLETLLVKWISGRRQQYLDLPVNILRVVSNPGQKERIGRLMATRLGFPNSLVPLFRGALRRHRRPRPRSWD